MKINYRFKTHFGGFTTKQQKTFSINSIENNEKLFTWALKHFENLLNEYEKIIDEILNVDTYFCLAVNEFEFILMTPTSLKFTYRDTSYIFDITHKDNKFNINLLPQNNADKGMDCSNSVKMTAEENKNENSTCKEIEEKNGLYCATLPEAWDHDVNHVCDKEDTAASTINKDGEKELEICDDCVFSKIVDSVTAELTTDYLEDEAYDTAERIFNALNVNPIKVDFDKDYSYIEEIYNRKVKTIVLMNAISADVCELVCDLLDAHGDGKFYTYYSLDSDKTYFTLSLEPFND
jgi:hypothetical protein